MRSPRKVMGPRVVQHRAESLPIHASAGGVVTCVRDGPDLTGGAVLDVDATKTADDEGGRGENLAQGTPRLPRAPGRRHHPGC